MGDFETVECLGALGPPLTISRSPRVEMQSHHPAIASRLARTIY